MQFSGRRFAFLSIPVTLLCVISFIPGCGTRAPSDVSNTANKLGTFTSSAMQGTYVAVDSTTYDPKSQAVTLHVHKVGSPGSLHGKGMTGEQLIDVSTAHGPTNFAVSHYPTKQIKTVHLVYPHQSRHTVQVPSELAAPSTQTSAAKSSPETGAAAFSGSLLAAQASGAEHGKIPPGVKMDHSIHSRVKITAPVKKKENAVINVARSKLGTPYIWGHNEDRGQYGFDCSNFTAYVYHHALGYKFTGASRGQAKYVGRRVPRSDMRRGDLIIFEHGKHVGIYAGKDQVIQEGGGLGKVGYLSLGPGSYWGKHITSVKRMF